MNLRSVFSYFFSAQNEHGLHSPFVFDLYRNIIKKDEHLSGFENIEALRHEMLQSREKIQVTDFGAGSKINASPVREVRDIAAHSKKSARLGRLFYRLICHFGHEHIFDLGTSLGLTTLYLAAPPSAKVTTFEGCPETAKIANRNFTQFAVSNQPSALSNHPSPITTIVGNLDEVLSAQVDETPKIDFAFFDANHRLEPTLRYFETCLQKAHNDTLFVFDDIHWSDEMETAWAQIKAHPSVTVTIDLFAVGLVFFRKQQRKQHFVLRWPFWK
ncbi:MAG: class I SAM-dependent methyltransferase [Spirosomataceae bacterium]